MLSTMAGCCSARELQVGDPGVRFDDTLISRNSAKWPQMAKWKTAGVRGGIPFVDNQKIRVQLKSGANSSQINAAIATAVSKGGGAVYLENGTYNINATVKMKSNVSLIGQSRHGVKCIINKNMKKNNAFEFLSGVKNSGIYRLTIRGGWLNKNGENKPFYDWNIKSDKNNELNGNECISVFFNKSEDCWIDDMDILNSADFPVRSVAKHITLRNLKVDGCFNKHGGCHGYFFLLKGYNLVTKCEITHIRHISIQGNGESEIQHDGAEYNVFYDNDLYQEISFHSTDEGNNLIENNRITLPSDMPGKELPNYYAIMGPWSSQHHISEHPNFIYKNQCLEKNNGHSNMKPWSNSNIVYYGPWFVKPSDPYTNFTKTRPGQSNSALSLPIGGTLYPVQTGTTPNPDPTPDSDSPIQITAPDFDSTVILEGSTQQLKVKVSSSKPVRFVRVLIDGTKVAQKDGSNVAFSNLFKPLSAGNHAMRVSTKFTDNSWEKVELTFAVVNHSGGDTDGGSDDNAAPAAKGLVYSYYEGAWSSLPDFGALSQVAGGSVENFNLAPRLTNGKFGLVFSGFVNIPTTGRYTFTTQSNDGSKLFIGDKLVVNNDGKHSAREKSGSIQLQSGRQPISVQYFNNGGSYVLNVYWKGPGVSKQLIPSSRLFR